MKHLTAVSDAPSDEEARDLEWRRSWSLIASACEEGLKVLHPQHPRRSDLIRLSVDAHRAAGLRREPLLQSV